MKTALSVIVFAGLVLVLLVFGISQMNQYITEHATYTTPTTGMNASAFLGLCGDPDKAKPVNGDESTMVATYEGSPARYKNGCYGNFSFSNGKLESIASLTPKPAYNKPTIGMDYDAFSALCGKPLDDDTVATLETKNGKIYTWKYADSPKHTQSGCSGTFQFHDDELASISRR